MSQTVTPNRLETRCIALEIGPRIVSNGIHDRIPLVELDTILGPFLMVWCDGN